MTKTLGQTVIIDNKPGGNGCTAIQAAKAAAPDGCTFVPMDDAHMSPSPQLYKKILYDMTKDIDLVGTSFRSYFFVVTGTNSSLKSVNEIIATAKVKPGALT